MFNKKAKKEEGKFSASDVFGVTDKRADEILRTFRHAKIDCKGWVEVLEYVKKECKLEGEAEFTYFGYMFGRMYEQNEDPMRHFLGHLLSH